MKNLLLLLALAAPAAAVTNSPYAPTIRTSTATGVTTMSVPGVFNVAAGSASADTPVIALNGATGVVSATSFTGSGAGLTGLSGTFTGGTITGQTTFVATATHRSAVGFGTASPPSSFTVAGGLFMASGSSITLSGANGYITTGSSVTASAFFGNGAGITGIATTFTGGIVTGVTTFQSSVTMQNGSASVGGVGNFVIVASSVGIGVGVPTQRLDVYGAVQQNGGILTSSGPYSSIVPNARGFAANDLLLSKLAVTDVAAGSYSVLTGGYGTAAAGAFSGVFGGRANQSNADYTFVGAGYGNIASATYAVIVGGQNQNSGVTAGTYSGIVSGGSNRCQGSYCFVGGGDTNFNLGNYSALGGGSNNSVAVGNTADYAFLGGGSANSVGASYAAVAGGISNTANGANAFVGGGTINAANGVSSMVPGGSSNTATGDYSFAAGFRASAGARGSFVWADASQNTTLTNSTTNSFLVRAAGGVVLQTSSITVQGNSYLGSGPHITSATTSGYFMPPSWTLAQIQAATPASTELGGLIICSNCSSAYSICQSTGATLNGFRLGTTGTSACQ